MSPKQAEMVVCLDGHIDDLDEIEELCQGVLFFVGSLNDRIVNQWVREVMERFDLQRVQVTGDSVCIVAFSL